MKFNKEERKAIIKKLSKIANERTNASWEKQRKLYKPSEAYLQVQLLLEQRNEACKHLTEFNSAMFNTWAFNIVNTQSYLNNIRDQEIEHLVEKYDVNETDLDVEIILMDQDKPIDELIERLLVNCLCK